ncbi:peptidoglycan binding domain-containing protein [Komagataeibacter kakiaceti]|uniref:hypothetical protein n=1 Tax=Komagataeibacter kakiaceti TaxID=943261 RepID=UPI0004718C78|nr:hypothetical protein [Komagataeibacter kakiaceti]
MVADFGFNVGIRVAARQLQAAVGMKGVALDGDIGPAMISAVLHALSGPAGPRLIGTLTDMQAAYYRNCRLFNVDGEGWLA